MHSAKVYMARVHLAIQATSAPSERIFSMASLIITKMRNRLGPEIAGKLLYLKQNWDVVNQSIMRAASRGEAIEIE